MTDWQAYRYAKMKSREAMLTILIGLMIMATGFIMSVKSGWSLSSFGMAVSGYMTLIFGLIILYAGVGSTLCRRFLDWLFRFTGGRPLLWDAFEVEVEYGDQQ